jgi:hypothetical protein
MTVANWLNRRNVRSHYENLRNGGLSARAFGRVQRRSTVDDLGSIIELVQLDWL